MTQPDGGHRLATEGSALFCLRLENEMDEEPPINWLGSTISKGSFALPATGGTSGPHDQGQCHARRRDSSLFNPLNPGQMSASPMNSAT
ncbi:MAG: hypothetical protein EOQ28_09410 [Mesorhizobium sp.]|uniref:hypothetical protein n=1 Tax=Mesorhizobium sp. TaxID=1871066 RepID=UPI000FE9EF44|nr:hypothetical protein [Mesorhizobium sp.]RWA75305.1 MAG: hypothetical protein EOQ28_09410 [Mesorhizobium sp.]